jgi:hypothetical protein
MVVLSRCSALAGGGGLFGYGQGRLRSGGGGRATLPGAVWFLGGRAATGV